MRTVLYLSTDTDGVVDHLGPASLEDIREVLRAEGLEVVPATGRGVLFVPNAATPPTDYPLLVTSDEQYQRLTGDPGARLPSGPPPIVLKVEGSKNDVVRAREALRHHADCASETGEWSGCDCDPVKILDVMTIEKKESNGSNGHGEAAQVSVTASEQIGWTTASDGTLEPVMGMPGSNAREVELPDLEIHTSGPFLRADGSDGSGPRKLPSARLLEILESSEQKCGGASVAAARWALEVVGKYLDEREGHR